MLLTTTVTQKGQITLPKVVRDALGIKTYSKVTLKAGKGHVRIYPTFDILDLAGTFKPKKGLSVMKAREYMEKHYQRF